MKIFLIAQVVIIYLLLGAVIGTAVCAVDEDGDMDSSDTKGFIVSMAFIWPVYAIGFIAILVCSVIYNQILRPLYDTVLRIGKKQAAKDKSVTEDEFDRVAREHAESVSAKKKFAAHASLEPWWACKDCPLWEPMCKNCTDSSDRLEICENRDDLLELVGGDKDA